MHKNPHAVALGRLGGKRSSDAKRKAAQTNGRLGGRPKKLSDDNKQRHEYKA